MCESGIYAMIPKILTLMNSDDNLSWFNCLLYYIACIFSVQISFHNKVRSPPPKKNIKSLRESEKNATILFSPLPVPSISMPTATPGCQKEKPFFSF